VSAESRVRVEDGTDAPSKATTPPLQETVPRLVDSPEVSEHQPSGFHRWLHRISIFLFVLISAVAGVLLVILPWTPQWTDNSLFLSFPALRTFVSSGFVRGICSGLGLLDIWIGFWEALHYHEQS